MAQFMMDNGSLGLDMARESRYGKTVVTMRVIGATIKHMVRVD